MASPIVLPLNGRLCDPSHGWGTRCEFQVDGAFSGAGSRARLRVANSS